MNSVLRRAVYCRKTRCTIGPSRPRSAPRAIVWTLEKTAAKIASYGEKNRPGDHGVASAPAAPLFAANADSGGAQAAQGGKFPQDHAIRRGSSFASCRFAICWRISAQPLTTPETASVVHPHLVLQRQVQRKPQRLVVIAMQAAQPVVEKPQLGAVVLGTAAQRERAIAEWMAQVQERANRYPAGFVVDDSRESTYEGRGE